MGLDMYLSKKTYVKRWSHQQKKDQFTVTVKRGSKKFDKINPERVSYIVEEVMYWRKANQIHGWFVDNTEEISDNVKYYVTHKDLVNLVDTCKKVVEILNNTPTKKKQVCVGWKNGEEWYEDIDVYDNVDEVMKILPPTRGFFFGSDSVDKWYKEELENTIEVLTKELEISDKYDEYEYYASW